MKELQNELYIITFIVVHTGVIFQILKIGSESHHFIISYKKYNIVLGTLSVILASSLSSIFA